MQLSDVQLAQVASGAGFSGESLVTAIAVALAESSAIVNNIGDGNTSFGLWQIHTPAHPQYNRAQLLNDANYNAAAAWDISSGGTNWYPWSTWKNGAYRRYLARARDAAAAIGGYSQAADGSGQTGDDGQYVPSENQSDFDFTSGTSPLVLVGVGLAGLFIARRLGIL